MAATPSVKVVKSLLYKGETIMWSNRYHFAGGTPANDSAWQTLFTNIRNAEKLVHYSGIGIREVLGYEAGSEIPVATWEGDVAGTGGFSDAVQCPGNDVAIVRYSTTQRTTKNHPIYLFNYYHGVHRYTSTTDANELSHIEKSALETYADAWISGFSDGTNTYNRAGPNGAVAQTRLVDSFITHRDFRN